MLKERISILENAGVISAEVAEFVNQVIDEDLVAFMDKESILEMFTTHLAMAAQRICTGQEVETLDESIWNEEAIGADNTVAVHIRHIREKIEINPKDPQYLKVVWGVGYKIEKIEPR